MEACTYILDNIHQTNDEQKSSVDFSHDGFVLFLRERRQEFSFALTRLGGSLGCSIIACYNIALDVLRSDVYDLVRSHRIGRYSETLDNECDEEYEVPKAGIFPWLEGSEHRHCHGPVDPAFAPIQCEGSQRNFWG